MCMVGVMQGQYYLVWDSYYRAGLKVFNHIRSQLQIIMLYLYTCISMQCPTAYALIKYNQAEVVNQVTKVGSQVRSWRWSQVSFKSCRPSSASQVI